MYALYKASYNRGNQIGQYTLTSDELQCTQTLVHKIIRTLSKLKKVASCFLHKTRCFPRPSSQTITIRFCFYYLLGYHSYVIQHHYSTPMLHCSTYRDSLPEDISVYLSIILVYYWYMINNQNDITSVNLGLWANYQLLKAVVWKIK